MDRAVAQSLPRSLIGWFQDVCDAARSGAFFASEFQVSPDRRSASPGPSHDIDSLCLSNHSNDSNGLNPLNPIENSTPLTQFHQFLWVNGLAENIALPQMRWIRRLSAAGFLCQCPIECSTDILTCWFTNDHGNHALLYCILSTWWYLDAAYLI